MSKKKKTPPPQFATKKSSWHGNHFVPLFEDMLNSPAYRGLTAHSKEAYTILRQEYLGEAYTGNNIICPYSTFQSKGMRPNTLSRALAQLEAFGFVDIEGGGLGRHPNIYHFSERWKTINTPEDVARIEDELKAAEDAKKLAKEKAKAAPDVVDI